MDGYTTSRVHFSSLHLTCVLMYDITYELFSKEIKNFLRKYFL